MQRTCYLTEDFKPQQLALMKNRREVLFDNNQLSQTHCDLCGNLITSWLYDMVILTSEPVMI